MPDTDRLYALSGTYSFPFLPAEAGPGLLVNDALVAMHWYLTHEREDHFAVSGHVSDDDGVTWQPLSPSTLWADAKRALAPVQQTSSAATGHSANPLQLALDDAAATWLDARMRHIPPGAPAPHSARRPGLPDWERGGQIWALTLGTIPHEAMLARLTNRYVAPQPEGAVQLHTGALDTLHAIAIAEDPRHEETDSLLKTLAHLTRLTSGYAMGQLRGLAEDPQRAIMDEALTRFPVTAAVADSHPDPQHPAQLAARAYLHHLSGIGPGGDEHLRTGARRDLVRRLAAAEAAAESAPPAPDSSLTPAALPGYPRQLVNDQLAAAEWRDRSPMARQAAKQAMGRLAEAFKAMVEVTNPRSPDQEQGLAQQEQAVLTYTERSRHLEELDAQHALLMHAAVLADAESAAKTAAHTAIVAAQQATASQGQGTLEEARAMYDRFMDLVNEAEERIAPALAEQRQLACDTMHRLFPDLVGNTGMVELREMLVEKAGLGIGALKDSYHRIMATSRDLEQLDTASPSNTTESGPSSVTAGQVDEARTRAQEAEDYYTELQTSRKVTLGALAVMDGVAGLAPSYGPAAARAARILAQSRERALRVVKPTAHEPSSDRQQAQEEAHQQTPPPGPGPLR